MRRYAKSVLRWRRDDSAYAGAAIAAVLVVAYLMAGNFGLLPSPLVPPGAEASPNVAVPSLAIPVDVAPTADGQPFVPGVPVVVPGQPGDDDDAVAPTPQPPLPAPPAVSFTTADGTIMVRLTTSAKVTGVAQRAERVEVAFSGGSLVRAELQCQTSTCTWEAPAPGILGSFTVTATAFDVHGRSTTADPITITVVDLSLSGESSDRGPLADPVETVGGLVGNTLEVVGGLLGL